MAEPAVNLLDNNIYRLVVEALKERNKRYFRGYVVCKRKLRAWRYLALVLGLDEVNARALSWWLEDEFLQAFLYGKNYGYCRGELAPWESLYHQGVMGLRRGN